MSDTFEDILEEHGLAPTTGQLRSLIAEGKSLAMSQCSTDMAVSDAIIRERQLVALYLHSFAGSQVDPVEVAEAVLTGAHMVAV